MATAEKDSGTARKGFRNRRPKNPPKEDATVEPVETETAGVKPGQSGSDPEPTESSKTPGTSESATSQDSPPSDSGGAGVGKDPVMDHGTEGEVLSGGVLVPKEPVVEMGVSTTTDLWRYYKKLYNRSGVEGKPVKVAQIIRVVLAEALPDSSTEEGLASARQYAEHWNQVRDASSSPRTNRQLYLPQSMVTELKRLSMMLEDRGYPTSTSAIVCGILDKNRPASLANIRKLASG